MSFAAWIGAATGKKRRSLIFVALTSLLTVVSCGAASDRDEVTSPPWTVDGGIRKMAVSGDGRTFALMADLGQPQRNAAILTDLETGRVWRYFVSEETAIVRSLSFSQDGTALAFITEDAWTRGSKLWIVRKNGEDVTTVEWADQRRVRSVVFDERGNLFYARDVRILGVLKADASLAILNSYGIFYFDFGDEVETRIAPELTWYTAPDIAWVRSVNTIVMSANSTLAKLDMPEANWWKEIEWPPVGEGEQGYRISARGLKVRFDGIGRPEADGGLFQFSQEGSAPNMRGIVVEMAPDGAAIVAHNTFSDTYRRMAKDPRGLSGNEGKQVLLACQVSAGRVDCDRALPKALVGMGGLMAISEKGSSIVMYDWSSESPPGLRIIFERFGTVKDRVIEPGKSSEDKILTPTREIRL